MDEERPCEGCGENLAYKVNGHTYSKATSVEIRGIYDGGLFYAHTKQNGGCGYAWHRWAEGTDLHSKAEPYVALFNRKANA